MARRRLLNDEQWARLLGLPSGERDVVRHCTLTPDDLALVAGKRSAPNRLGYALLLCALRHPGRALEPGEAPLAPMVAYVARQLGVAPDALGAGPDRPQTRREQLAELTRRGGFRSFGRAEARDLVAWLTPVAQASRKPAQLAGLLVEELRRRRILLPTPRVLELVVHHARIRAERALQRALTDGMDPAQLATLDGLLAAPAAAEVRPGLRGCVRPRGHLRRATWSAWSSACVPCGRSVSTGTARERYPQRHSTRSPERACA